MRRTMMLVGLMVALLTVSAEAHRIIRPGNDLAGFTDTTSNAPIQAVALVDTFGNPASLGGGAGSEVTVLNESLHVYGAFTATLGDTVTVTGSVDIADVTDTVDVTIQNDSLKTYGNVAVTGTVTVATTDTVDVTIQNDSLKTYGNVAVTGTVTATVGNDSLKTYTRLTNDSLKTYFGAVPTVNSRIAARTDLVHGTAALQNPNEETQVLAAVTGKNLDLTTLVIANPNGALATVSIRDSIGGSVVMTLTVGAESSVCFTFPVPFIQTVGTNNKWTAASDVAPCTVTMQAVKY